MDLTLSPDQLISILQSVDSSSFVTELDRAQVKEALFAAFRRVQLPFDVLLGHVWTEPAVTGAIQTLIQAGFWKKWLDAGGQSAHVDALAKISDLDSALLRRLLAGLSGQRLLDEAAPNTYSLTPFARALGEDKFSSIYTFLYGMNQPCYANFPKFMAETGYKIPENTKMTNFESWRGSGQSLFKMLSEEPDVGVAFNNGMTELSAFNAPWTKVYPVNDIALGAKPDQVLLVDVGGGLGHDLEKFLAEYPQAPEGSLVLQDLAHVVEKAQLRPPCVAQVHDFFTPQPVKGARAYFLRCVLHDWPDMKAIEILKNLTAALQRGYSKILLCEIVIASSNAHPQTTVSDMNMLMSGLAVERNEEQWRFIVTQAGLKISKIWSSAISVYSVIEIELL